MAQRIQQAAIVIRKHSLQPADLHRYISSVQLQKLFKFDPSFLSKADAPKPGEDGNVDDLNYDAEGNFKPEEGERSAFEEMNE
jgi:hypothetical protein